jgi:Secretion system C-terminal sorting domain
MKNLFLFILLYFTSQYSHSMIIKDISASSMNNQDINIHLKVEDSSIFSFSNSSFTIVSNTITLTCCYNTLYFTAVTTLENDFIIPNLNLNTSNYNLVVIVNFQNFPGNVCEYSILSDTETLNFNTPITGTISLTNNNFINNIYNLKIYPNPTSGILKIEGLESATYSISIIDNLGRKILNLKEISNNTIDIFNLTEGYYFIKINTEVGTSIKKIVLKK